MPKQREYFVLTLPLQTEKWQEDVLEKRFEVNREIYNALLRKAYTRYRQMCQTRQYREAIAALKNTADAAERKSLYQIINGLTERYRLRKYDLTKDVAEYRKYFKENTDSPIVQNLAVDVWKTIDHMIGKMPESLQVKQADQFHSLSGKTNQSSILFRQEYIFWKKLRLPISFHKNSNYEQEALQSEIKYCRLKRKLIRGIYKYYVDLVMKGRCPIKESLKLSNQAVLKTTVSIGQADRQVNVNKIPVGIDLGMRQIAVVAPGYAGIYPLLKPQQTFEKKKKILRQKMHRSRQVTGKEVSNHYMKLRVQYREICRKQVVKKREYQQNLVKKLIPLGTEFYVERLNFRKIAQSYYGKQIEQAAPASFIKMLENKLTQTGRRLYRMDPVKLKVSGWNHAAGVYEKIPPGRTERTVDGNQVNKYLYSAFLLMNANPETERIDTEQCEKNYEQFLDSFSVVLKRA